MSSILLVAGNEGDDLVKISADVSIFDTPEGYQSEFGVIYGERSCEINTGTAEVREWTYEGCSPSRIGASGNCQIPADGENRRSDFTFVSDQDTPGGLGVRFNVTAEDVPSRVYDSIIPDSAVKAGHVYTVRTAGSPKKEFQGKTMTFQKIIFRKVDNSVVACREANFDNV